MYGREVKIGNTAIWVWCTPTTALSEVLERAAQQLRKQESVK